ncbi:hypothetical protein TNCT_422771 [Trichonephila clavata]|uniref:Transposase n=2 Tax=Trichonephila clavata TaxID=2740835 RepID=A0A8X6J9N3_TRICU|nr:hypothetical protein TNCT_422771 [Trichonephila clavata]
MFLSICVIQLKSVYERQRDAASCRNGSVVGTVASGTFDTIPEAFNDEAMSRASIFRWQKAFKQGRQNMEGIERGRRPPTSRH